MGVFQESGINADAVTNAQFLYYFSMSVSSIDSFLRLKFRARECFSRSKGFLTGMGADLAHHVIPNRSERFGPFCSKTKESRPQTKSPKIVHTSFGSQVPGTRVSEDSESWTDRPGILSILFCLVSWLLVAYFRSRTGPRMEQLFAWRCPLISTQYVFAVISPVC